MKVEFYKTLWGMGGTLDEKLAAIKGAGYDGFEEWMIHHATVKPLCEKHGLKYLGMIGDTDPEAFKRSLGEAFDAGVVAVTVHAGRQHWSFDQGADFLGKVLEHTKSLPFSVNFETHRGRLLYEPLSTAKYLNLFPDLHLVADFSHWTVVTESMLDPYKDALDLAIARTRHIHARVGHEEGPQTPDPNAKMWEGHRVKFEGWWDRIKAAHEAKNAPVLTVDPEFGPMHYMWSTPDGKPVADLWTVTNWMKDHLKSRWKA